MIGCRYGRCSGYLQEFKKYGVRVAVIEAKENDFVFLIDKTQESSV